MPQKELKYINVMDDRRRKLDPKEHKLIKEMKKTMSSNEIAKKYGVSVSLIKLIVYPRRQQSMKERNKRVWKDYAIHYGKEYHKLAIRKIRKRKRELGLMLGVPEEKKCLFCGKVFVGRPKQRYCSKKCAWTVGNLKRKEVKL